MWGRKKKPEVDWLHDEHAAREEALQRILVAKAKGQAAAAKMKKRRDTGVQLFLSDLSALRSLPDEIAELRGVTHVFLGRAMRGEERSAGLTRLADISALAGASELQYLCISGTQVQDLSPLAGLEDLAVLDMEGVPVSSLEPIASNPKLSEIYMSRSAVSSLTPLAELPAAQRGEPVRFGVTGIPALADDPRLTLLARLSGVDFERTGREIFEYLNGTHPAFRTEEAPFQQALRDRLAISSPVQFVSNDGKIAAVNRTSPTISDRQATDDELRILAVHAASLLEEAATKQIPQDLHARLVRYQQRVAESGSLFISMDSAMSFIRGSLRDDYFRLACDGGFLEACDHLVSLHDAISARFVTTDADLDRFLEHSSNDIDPEEIRSAVSMANDAASQPLINAELAASAIEALQALHGYAEAATQGAGGTKGVRRVAIGVAAVLAALASASQLHAWANSNAGQAFVRTIREAIVMLLRVLGL